MSDLRDDDFEAMLAGYDRIIHDKALQQELLNAGLLVRVDPTTGEPRAALEASEPPVTVLDVERLARAMMDVLTARTPFFHALLDEHPDRFVPALVDAALIEGSES